MEHIFITDIGHEQCPSDKEMVRYNLNHHTIHFVYSGSGFVDDVQVQAGEIFLCRGREHPVYMPSPENPWHYGWIGGCGALFDKLLSDMGFTDTCHIRTMHNPALIELLIRAGTASKEQEYRCGLFYAIAGLHIAAGEQIDDSMPARHIRIAVSFIESMSGNTTPDEVAKNLNLSRAYLRNLFSSSFGISLQHYILRYRMQHAEALLTSTDLSISAIGAQIGYRDPLMFSKMFRRYHGQSPTAFRTESRMFKHALNTAWETDPRYRSENAEQLLADSLDSQ